jgi:hypothetical protein
VVSKMQNGEVRCIVTGDVGRVLHASRPDVLVSFCEAEEGGL